MKNEAKDADMTHPSDTPLFLASDHLSRRTHDILKERLEEDSSALPRTLSPTAFAVLERLVTVLLPQEEILGQQTLNLALRVDMALSGPRDGWRFAELPSDIQAWEQALLTLNDLSISQFERPFPQLEDSAVKTFLDGMGEGKVGLHTPDRLQPPQMQKWSLDLRADVIECFLADPRVQDRLGMSANLNGGDERFQGFETVQANEREDFEPITKICSAA
ncbi:hypothetical protein AD940_03955 [Gluconobacter thailandicus]|nr:hypothetical protein AD940_03955 [Gluconobacter thailandicus]